MTILFNVTDALDSLNIKEWALSGFPTNEEEFLTYFSKVVDVDENNHAVFSKDPQTFGVTWNQIQTEIQRLQSAYDTTKYQRTRKTQYPSIGDQLDMLWHAIDSGSLDKDSDFYTALKAVKDANPKA
jgi:hypothetical protein